MNIYIWGTSPLAGRIVGDVIPAGRVTGFIDNFYEKESFMDKPVSKPDVLLKKEYDAVVAASTYADEIYSQCTEIGLDMKKIIFPFANVRLTDLNTDYGFVEKVLGSRYAQVVKNRNHMIQDCDAAGSMCLKGSRLKQDRSYKNDFVRHRVFELCVKEIRKKNLDGAAAELGVYRGQFAQYINAAFPGKTLYLFDTFEGFDEELARAEVNSGTATETWVESFKNTDIEIVMDRMVYKDTVRIEKGRFPETAGGGVKDERFLFVSIDVDMEQPVYDGLKFFYPRLQQGGYIFIHDYNGPLFGVERAVDRYEKEMGIDLCRVPVCDTEGTLVITK